MSKPKFPPEIKIHACEDFLSGKYTSAQVCEKYGITYNEKNCSSTSLSEWVAKYRAVGPEAFTHFYHNKSYSSELKTQAVEEYLSGKGTILEITVKYGISDTKVFRRWILKYNVNIELKSYDPKKGETLWQIILWHWTQEPPATAVSSSIKKARPAAWRSGNFTSIFRSRAG